MGFKIVLSKELRRVFMDKKMIFSMFILPIIVMGLIISMMSYFSNSQKNEIEEHKSSVIVKNAPEDFKEMISHQENLTVSFVDAEADINDKKELIKNGELDIIVEFPKGFLEAVSEVTEENVKELPQVLTFFNPSEENSKEARNRLVNVFLESYRISLLEKRFGSYEFAAMFVVDRDNPGMIVQDDKKATGKFLGTIVPYFVTIMLFAGSMGIGIDSFAGEKERGTFAKLLLSPAKRSEIVLGKITGLGIVSFISAIIYIVSMAVISKLTGTSMFGEMEGFSLEFSSTQIVQFAILIIGSAILYLGIIGMISVLCKNMKEAQTFITPAYFVVMVAGMITMFTNNGNGSFYFIPIFNTSFAFQGIFMETISVAEFITVAAVTYGAAVALIYAMVKAISSEKIMLNA